MVRCLAELKAIPNKATTARTESHSLTESITHKQSHYVQADTGQKKKSMIL
jgi:hypothetical protein